MTADHSLHCIESYLRSAISELMSCFCIATHRDIPDELDIIILLIHIIENHYFGKPSYNVIITFCYKSC